jgi:hypothetical protein
VYGELNEKYLAEKEMEVAEDEILLDSGSYGYPPGSGGDAESGESHEASKSHLGDLKESWEVSSSTMLFFFFNMFSLSSAYHPPRGTSIYFFNWRGLTLNFFGASGVEVFWLSYRRCHYHLRLMDFSLQHVLDVFLHLLLNQQNIFTCSCFKQLFSPMLKPQGSFGYAMNFPVVLRNSAFYFC